MEEKTETICRLCFRIILDGFFELIENIRGLLEELQFDLNVSISEEPLVCHDCTIMLQKYHDFIMGIKAEIALTSFVNSSDTYLNETKHIKYFKTSENQILCRFCMKIVVNNYVCKEKAIEEDIVLKNMLQTCVPELDENFADRSTICEPCFESLQNVFQFKMNCLDIEKKIKMYCEIEGTNSKGKVNLHRVLQFTSKMSMGDTSSRNAETERKIETEICNTDVLVKCPQQDTNLQENLKLPVNKEKIEPETVQKYERFDQVESKSDFTNQTSEETKDKSKSKNNRKQKNEITKHTCQLCPFETKKRTYLINHMLSHKDPSEIKMHKCSLCTFESKYKSNFNVHLLKHKNSSVRSARNIYKCQLCMYDTHIEYRFNTHMLLHKKSSEETMYNCEVCSFKTKCRDELDSHMIVHKDSSEPLMYKCEQCTNTFETKDQNIFKNHILTHKNPAEMETYKCEVCTFETNDRNAFNSHKIIHKNPSDIITYKCVMCNYESIHKGDLTKHFLMHKTSSKMTMYKCDLCVYQTKRMGNMRAHIITHKKASETNMYKCSDCNFETKYRGNFRTHLLKHKDMSEVVTYMCDMCTYVTKHKGDLNRHKTVHNKA